MNKMTAEEIINILSDNEISVRDFAYGEFEEEASRINEDGTDEYGDKKLPKGTLGNWEEIARYGGAGKGDTWYSVKYFEDHDVFIRTDGWYQSYYGAEFEDGYGREVRPQEKVITVYE